MTRRCLLVGLGTAFFAIAGMEPISAQVFDVSPTASTGDVEPGTGEAFYGTFGLSAATNTERSYGVYRKLDGVDRVDTLPDLHTLTPVPGNATAATWEGVDHGGSGTQSGFHDPGMYIGNSPSTSTYSDQLIYFSSNRNGTTTDDFDGGVGGDNLPQETNIPDSNDRVNWEVAVGFLEDPDGFIDGRAPNSSNWDMWSADWGSDGISMRLFFSATDSPDIENSDWFSFNESAGGAIGARTQSGDSAVDEATRDPIEVRRRHVGSGTEIDEFDGDFPAGGSDGMAVHIGVGYDDEMELSWRMELNDPDNADPKLAREVRMTAKTGNLEYYSVFDPGAADDPVIPNENVDDATYSDGFFDWQSATPVFYLGLDNGTDYGENGASGIMGVFLPGDFNADGTVDNSDLEVLQNHMGQVDTSYSRGDMDQDGDTDMDDLTAWQTLGGGGNLADQIDQITNLDDRTAFVHDVANTWLGDSNLDGEFNSGDLVEVFALGQYEDGTVGNSTWASGDWNGDGDFDSGDFVTAFSDGGYEQGVRPAARAAVPEPGSTTLLLFAIVCFRSVRRLEK